MNQTILESQHDHRQLLLDESKYKKSHPNSSYAREREREQREQLEHLGLSEVEAVEYVLMLSRDEANSNARIEGGSRANISETQLEAQGIFEGDFDIELNTDNDEEDDYDLSSRRSSTSSTFIPSWSSSSSLSTHSSYSSLTAMTRTTTAAEAMRRSIPRPIPSSSNEKIQVSPPFRAEPMGAGEEYNAVRSSTSEDANTNMGEEMEAHIFPPIVSDGVRNIGNEVQDLKKEDGEKDKGPKGKKKKNRKDTRKDRPEGKDKAPTAELPSANSSSSINTLISFSPSSSASSTSASAWSSASSVGQNYGQRRASTSTPAFAGTAPRNAWTSGGPSLSARISPPTPHYRQQQQSGRRAVTSMDSNMDMDEDLKFAIELSLVEARSRGESV